VRAGLTPGRPGCRRDDISPRIQQRQGRRPYRDQSGKPAGSERLKAMFEPVSTQKSFPEIEQEVLRFWREHDTFRKSLEQRKDCPQYVFYDGPPFATGLPHYGHLLAGAIKDVVPRYQTMCGKYVERTFGWDCHGLPVENEMEKELGIRSKREIIEYGVARFNEACRSIVLRYTKEWEYIVERIGRWVDFEHGYRTMDRDYMESIWWVFRRLWDMGLIYQGHKILPYCPRCATPLSNFEASQGYREVRDPSVTVRFQSMDDPRLYFLAWTTTPWTLPSNLALAVGPDLDYVQVHEQDADYILAEARLSSYWRDETPNIVARFKGRDLVGRRYHPLFPWFEHLAEKGAFRIVPADYVSVEDGSGIVHTAPGFGEEDAETARREGLPTVCPVDDECRFTREIPDYAGRMVKEVDDEIIRRLKAEGKLVHRGVCVHNYPHCWRCESPLIYRAVSTWFVRVEAIKDRMLAANRQIRWVPAHIKEGRFGKWLENARDWAISRNRFWGCPIPIWAGDDGEEMICIGSAEELERLSGRSVPDLHKHFVDDVTIPSRRGKGVLRRVPEVLDCWFESGSMPYAQHHYPFENREKVEQHFPADFIAEGLDQTRGWFYTLMVIAAALFDKPPFKNVVVNGLVLAEDGRKMSKRLKNYPDPMDVMNTYGADALRLFLLSSPVVRAEDLRFSERGVREVMRTIIIPVWNAYHFLVTYARVDGWQPLPEGDAPPETPTNPLDRWILSRLQATISDVRDAMDRYDLQRAALRFTDLVEELTNEYIRRSRRRFWKIGDDRDKKNAYRTLHHVLVTFCRVAAPFIPFVTEAMYRNLRTPHMPDSVHLCDFPVPDDKRRDPALERRMQHARTAVSLGRFLRTQAGIRVRQPLPAAVLVSAEPDVRSDLEAMADVIAEELNVHEVRIHADEEELVDLSAKANYRRLGPRLGRRVRNVAAAIEKLDAAAIRRLRAGETIEVDPGDGEEPVPISLDDVEVRRSEKEGLTVANEGAVTAALDLRITEELKLEGLAREIVNRVQNLRKTVGLDVTDRIVLEYDLPDEIRRAVERHADYVARETLAVELVPARLDGVDPVDIDGAACRFRVRKSAAATPAAAQQNSGD